MTAPSAFARELGLRYPIVQGPMNGASPPALAVAVSNAGALGSCAAALFSPGGDPRARAADPRADRRAVQHQSVSAR
ncbi:nitronate monooxygenase [Serratia marcescens]|uniref:nitronate monooxygenase n=1 Tax=Serratia marcescens TaxID=615 RepID=UPI0024131B9D|nr:nitronate monooxygenase [Serratia marcescens]